MKLTSTSHFLISLSGAELRKLGIEWPAGTPKLWVGFDEYGKYRGHYPYIKSIRERLLAVRGAEQKARRVWNEVPNPSS